MRHPDVGLILATGGAGMVKAAYSSGTPALGVGPGNAPALVTADADLDHAARSIVASKSFDNGLICGAEHNLVVEQAAVAELSRQLERYGAAVLGPEEAEGFAAAAVDAAKDRFRPQIVGQSAALIAKVAGIRRPWPIRLVVVPRPWTGESTPWSREKMAPMLSLFTVASAEEGLAVARALLTFDGTGHTAIVHTGSDAFARRYAEALPASRVLVNSPGSHGVVGFCTALTPSFTLGCGTFGGNSTTDNVSFTHLRNLKRVARFIDPAARGLELPPGYPVPVT
jgi:acyl-CoA reductase-like NAD-dependent aldehyde dehydrogenase